MSSSPERQDSPAESAGVWHPAHEWLEQTESETDPEYDPTQENDGDGWDDPIEEPVSGFHHLGGKIVF